MMELRDKVIEAMNPGRAFDAYRAVDEAAADRILAIPEIAEALRCRNAVLASQMPNLTLERVGELIKGIKPPAP